MLTINCYSNGSNVNDSAVNQELNVLHQKAEQSSNADTILFYSKKALDIAKAHNFDISRTLLLMGDGYLQLGELSTALDCFTEAASLYENQDNQIGLATAFSYISTVYNAQHNQDNAILYSKKAIDVFTSINDSTRLTTAIHNLGYMYYTYNQDDSALLFFAKAQEMYEMLKNKIGIAYCIGNSGLVYINQQKCEQAKTNLNTAIEILKGLNDEYAITEYMIAYSKVLQVEGFYEEAIRYAKDSYTLAQVNNISEYKRDAAYRLAKLYEVTQRFDEAYYFLESYYAVRDSIKNLETIQQMADLRTEFEVNQKQIEVDNLTKRKTVQLIIISALLIIIILGCWIIVIYKKNFTRVREFTVVLEKRRKQLEKQRTELSELNSIKDKFFSIISHDLRAPINSLGGISIMIRESIENENYALLWEVVDYIDKTTFSLSSLLENLLNWGMFQQGKLRIEMGKVNVKPLINEVVSLFSTVIISKNIQLKLNVNDNVFILGEKNSLMMILRNLFSNALKFTQKGEIITISTERKQNKKVELIVKDQGVGIPKEKLENIFIISQNKSTYGTEKEKGLGLGLTLVYEFVNLNGGVISVESKVGVGTTFRILFNEPNE